MTTAYRNRGVMLRLGAYACLVAVLAATGLVAQHGHGSEGVGKAHMEISCLPAVRPSFDRALALLHNFWYARALTQFREIQKADPECAMAYWGAAMTYNHPLWDQPSQEDENAAWAYAARVTHAFAEDGWLARIRGVQGGGKVEGLPVHTFNTDDGDRAMKCPTEIAISDTRELELSNLGFLPLLWSKDSDFAAFIGAQSCQKPKKYIGPNAEDANAAVGSSRTRRRDHFACVDISSPPCSTLVPFFHHHR